MGRAGLLAGLLAGLRADLLAGLELHTFFGVVRGCGAVGKERNQRESSSFSETRARQACKRVPTQRLTLRGEGRKAQRDLELEDQACMLATLSFLSLPLAV